MRLQDDVAIVTGASRGIGRAVALTLAKQGASVVLAARDKAALAFVAQEVQDIGGNALICQVELTDEQSIKQLVQSCIDTFGKLTILVNNAGVTHSALLEKTTASDWDRCMNINARGAFLMCRECVPHLKNSGSGYVVNISSVVGVKGYPMQSAYTASKHALRGMTISLAEELKNDNVRVHVICPGGVDTEMVSRVRPDINKEELIEPQAIADLVLYLVTQKGTAVVDELHIRRATSSPWFS